MSFFDIGCNGENLMLPLDTNIFPFKSGVYVVGGSVRDLLAGRVPHDYDLVVRQDWTDFASRLSAMTGGHVVELGKHKQKMLRVVSGDRFFDIMPVSGDSIEDDLRRRDFTINAMAVDVSSGNLIDPFGGQKDLAAKKVRMVTREVFRSDPVRLVRAYRIAATFHFKIDKNTQAAIAADAKLIQESAGERIREEFFKILQCADSHRYLSSMARSDLLFSVFPEFLRLSRLRLPPAAPRSLLDETLDSYNHLEKLLDSEDEFQQSIGIQALSGDDPGRSLVMKLAILFHELDGLSAQPALDKGKTPNPDARARASAATAQSICRRLRFSRRQSDTIEMIIRNHFKPMLLFRAHRENSPVEKDFIRLFLTCQEVTPDVLLHALAEYRGRTAADDPLLDEFSAFIRMLIRRYYRVLLPRASLPPPIDGNDLINEFGLKPSVEFKHILNRVEEERLCQPAYSRENALKLVATLLNQT